MLHSFAALSFTEHKPGVTNTAVVSAHNHVIMPHVIWFWIIRERKNHNAFNESIFSLRTLAQINSIQLWFCYGKDMKPHSMPAQAWTQETGGGNPKLKLRWRKGRRLCKWTDVHPPGWNSQGSRIFQSEPIDETKTHTHTHITRLIFLYQRTDQLNMKSDSERVKGQGWRRALQKHICIKPQMETDSCQSHFVMSHNTSWSELS